MIRPIATSAAIALTAAGLVLVASPPASADCAIVHVQQIINNTIVLVEQKICGPSETAPVGQAGQDATLPPPAGSAVCIGGAIAIGLDPAEYCSGEDEDLPPAITGGLVARALRRLTLPASDLTIQPPGGRTLVNLDTNFFTTNDDPITRTVQLLGRPVELRIWPDRYTWVFGDGEETTTSTPGARYPDLEITHRYLNKGDYHPSLETTYTAEWRVHGGQWQPVPGTATIAGEPADLSAIEARPTLVGYGG